MPDPQDPFDENRSPEEQIREMLEQLLAGEGMNPDQLAGVAGLPVDQQALSHMLMQLRQAMAHPVDGVNWDLVRDAARRAAEPNLEVTDQDERDYQQALSVAQLWLIEATGTAFRGHGQLPTTITRNEWLQLTMDGWAELSNPVATSISDALINMMQEQAPEQMREIVDRSGPVVRSMGQSMFAMQLGQVLGQLAREVLSGGDIGMPVLPDGKAALVPQNLNAWANDLELDRNEVLIYFAVRELAHAYLFAQARWLRLHLVSSITEFARGIGIDASRIEETIRELDVSNPEEIRLVLQSGQLIPPRTAEQEQALERLETVLALIEGWVDVVTEDATSRLPNAAALSEMVRRRRATGSPAEHAFGSLVGMELRPRRLREAMGMWRAVTEAVGIEARDALWDHRDALPESEDIDDPKRLISRLQGTDQADEAVDELDSDLQRLLGDPSSFGTPPAGVDEASGVDNSSAHEDSEITGTDATNPPNDEDTGDKS